MTASRAVIRHARFALVAPVAKPTPLSGGRWSSSSSQRAAVSSTAAVAGAGCRGPVFWSHADTSQSAAIAAGYAAADDEAVEPRRTHRHEPRGGRLHELFDDGCRVQAALWQILREAREDAVDIQVGPDRSLGERVEPGPA